MSYFRFNSLLCDAVQLLYIIDFPTHNFFHIYNYLLSICRYLGYHNYLVCFLPTYTGIKFCQPLIKLVQIIFKFFFNVSYPALDVIRIIWCCHPHRYTLKLYEELLFFLILNKFWFQTQHSVSYWKVTELHEADIKTFPN